MVGSEVSLEGVVRGVVSEGCFSHNGVSFSLDDYFDGEVLNPDWVYFLARDVEDNRKRLRVSLDERYNVSPRRLYRAINDSALKKETNRPSLPHEAYFELVRLIEQNPEKYQFDEGYIQLARDLRAVGFKAHLGHVWSGAREHRDGLNWNSVISLPLDAFDKIDDLIKEDCGMYVGDEGYIQLARDLIQEGFKAHLGTVWSGAKEHREGLNWTGLIGLPLDAFDKIDDLIKEDCGRYVGDEGYIQLARDLRSANPKFKAHLGHVWSGAKEHREGLNWTGRIDLPLDAFDKIDDLIKEDRERYVGDEGYIQLARDLRSANPKFKAHLGHVWSGAKEHREGLNWTGQIHLPLDAFDKIDDLIKEDCGKYVGDEGYIQLARDLRQEGFSANLGTVWSGAKEHREGLNWTGVINLPLDAFDKIDDLIKEDCGKYVGDEGYIQLARDLRQEGFSANLGHVWSGAKEHREGLNWTGKIHLPLDAFDKIEDLIKEDCGKYVGDEGYIQLARDLRQEGFSANLGHVWSGAKQYREGLNWTSQINLPLDAFDKIDGLIKGDCERYRFDDGYVRLVQDLSDEGFSVNLRYIWAGAKEHRLRLGWSGVISGPLDAVLKDRAIL